jgi:hypothetical protein
MRYLALGAALMVAVSACAKEEKKADAPVVTTGTSTADRARAAATLANAIAANPTAADSILRANGHTQDSFQNLMYEIAADSAMSAVYSAAKSR